MHEVLTIEFDGGSRGNPGPAGIGVVVRAEDGTALVTLGRFIGHATNNAAEYQALITGLEQALALKAKRVYVRGDSELIVKQMKGEYRVRHPDLIPLYTDAQKLVRQFDQWKIDHNLRHKNKLADKLANLAMDRKGEVTDADDDPAGTVDEPSPKENKAGDRFACPKCGCAIELKSPSKLRPHQLKPFACQCGTRMNEV